MHGKEKTVSNLFLYFPFLAKLNIASASKNMIIKKFKTIFQGKNMEFF